MCKKLLCIPLFCILLTSVCAQMGKSQPVADRNFGWSLTVDASSKGKRADEAPLPTAIQRTRGEGDEIHVETDLVLSDILVQDKHGNPVVGLIPDDFEVTENGRSQRIEVFGYGSNAVPRSIILIIDHSLSQWRYIDTSIDAAKVLVDSLRPQDKMAIVSDDVKLIADLTSDKEALKAGLESLREKSRRGDFGKSYQYSALMAVLNERIRRDGTRNMVIFQSDGDQNALMGSDMSVGKGSYGFEDIVESAERKGVTIYTVFTGANLGGLSKGEVFEQTRKVIQDETYASVVLSAKKNAPGPVKLKDGYVKARAKRIMGDEKAVFELARRTGGTAQSLSTPDRASEIYANILEDIGRRYVIGYYPSASGRAAFRRDVRITVRKNKGHEVIGGRSYLAH